MNLPRYLYRGFDPASYEETSGGLRARSPGQPFEYVFRVGEVTNVGSGQVLRAGDGAVAGESDVNAVLRHQSDPDLGWRDCGISTTPHRERAQYYATHGGSRSQGAFLVIDTTTFEAAGVRVYRVAEIASNPSLPEDDEYVLVASDFGTLPETVVAERYEL